MRGASDVPYPEPMTDVEPLAPLAPHLARAQTIAGEFLATVERPIVVNGAAYVEWPCCEAPAHARAWAVAEARVATRMWATMVERGFIDATWLDAPSRRFACPVCFRRSRRTGANFLAATRGHGHRSSMHCPVCQGGGALATPTTCGGVVAMAAAAAAGLVEAVEAEVRAFALALAPWGARMPATMIWRLRPRPRGHAPTPLRRAAASAAVAMRPPSGPPHPIATDDDRRAAWRRAVAADAKVTRRPTIDGWPDDITFAALPDPFVPFDAIARLGAAIEDLRDEEAVIGRPPAELVGERFADLLVIEDRGRRRPAARPRP